MLTLSNRFLLAALLSFSGGVKAFCGDNGGVGLGWGTQSAADQQGFRTLLGFNSSGPYDAAGNPVLSVVSNNDPAWEAVICAQVSPDAYPQSNWGLVRTTSDPLLCFTSSALGADNITVSLQPCVNSIETDPFPTQAFEWLGTDFITYGFIFVGNQSGTAIPPNASTDYIPSLVPASGGVGAYLRLDFSPGGLPPSTGFETGMILDLSDD